MTSIQSITFACNAPDRLASFWAAALDRERPELPPEVAGGDDPDLAAAVDPDEESPALLFKRMPKGSTDDIPIHPDLAADDREATVERLVERGATAVETKRERFGDRVQEWTVMEDPEGNGFCVVDGALD